MTLAALNRPLTDLGGVPVLWDSDVGTLVQDPSQGGTNMYGPGDLFHDSTTGDIYQLAANGQLSLYRVATAPTVPAPAGVAAPSLTAGSAVGSAGPSWTNTAPSPPPAAITPSGNPTQWGHQVVTWLSTASFIGGLPNGLLLALGYVGYTFIKGRRRRNPRPILRNPSGGPRVVYNRLLGGWYVVVGRHQAPISGRFSSKSEAQAWLSSRRRNPGKRTRRLRGMMMQTWREATDPREYPSHQRFIRELRERGDPGYFRARHRRRHTGRTAQLREQQSRGWYRF